MMLFAPAWRTKSHQIPWKITICAGKIPWKYQFYRSHRGFHFISNLPTRPAKRPILCPHRHDPSATSALTALTAVWILVGFYGHFMAIDDQWCAGQGLPMSITSWDLKLHELRVDIIASNYGEISPAFIGGTAPPSICTLRKIHGFSETKKTHLWWVFHIIGLQEATQIKSVWNCINCHLKQLCWGPSTCSWDWFGLYQMEKDCNSAVSSVRILRFQPLAMSHSHLVTAMRPASSQLLLLQLKDVKGIWNHKAVAEDRRLISNDRDWVR